MAKQDILENTEAALDAIDSTFDILESQAEKVVTITKNNPFLMAGVAVVAIGVGGFLGYKLAVKRVSAHYEAILEREIAAAKDFHRRLAKDGEFSSPESAVGALVPDEVVSAVQAYQGRERKTPYNKIEEIEVVEEKVEVTRNVFVAATIDPATWDYEVEKADREVNPGVPYVISFEEFAENEGSHEQATLTYYAGDDILADAKDDPIDNTEKVVGDDNLLRFGHGSSDPNVVYVRNEALDLDFEIVKSNGEFAREVLGFIEHSDQRGSRRRENHGNRKFRWADE
jgi:hypothetical protein